MLTLLGASVVFALPAFADSQNKSSAYEKSLNKKKISKHKKKGSAKKIVSHNSAGGNKASGRKIKQPVATNTVASKKEASKQDANKNLARKSLARNKAEKKNSTEAKFPRLIAYRQQERPDWAPPNQYETIRKNLDVHENFIYTSYFPPDRQNLQARSKFQFDSRIIGIAVGTCHRDTIVGVVSTIFVPHKPRQLLNQPGAADNQSVAPEIRAVAGVEMRPYMDITDSHCANQSLERARDGQSISWKNPHNGRIYQITPYQSFQRKDESYCRSYQAYIKTYAETANYHYTACRSDEGIWQAQLPLEE